MVNIAGTEIPLVFIIPVAIGFLVLIGLVAVLLLRGGGKQESPQEQRLAIVIPVDDYDNMGVGKILDGVQRTENKIIIQDPDIIDNENQPKHFPVDITGVQPVKLIDLAKNLIELFVVFDRGEWAAQSFGALLKVLNKKRWDPLEADPQDIGDFYVGWGYLRKAFNQLLSTTSGKILFGAGIGLICYLLGIMTVALHVGHF